MRTLPALRTDLTLDPTPTWIDGHLSYLLIDPISSHYYRIDKTTLIVLEHWESISIDKFINKLHQLNFHDISIEDIGTILDFLTKNELIQAENAESIKNLSLSKTKSKLHWLKWLTHHYLFFKIPLFKPDAFLNKTYPYVSKLFSKQYAILVSIIFLISFYLTIQSTQSFFQPLDQILSWKGALYLFLSITLVKCIHELGHAYATKHFGCKVHSIGILFIVLYPIIYTDSTDAWRLHDSRKRCWIDCAGVIAELQLMAWFLLIWNLTDNPIIQNVIVYSFLYGLVSSLLINFNPLMRFDGYYALSNFVNVDNLQEKSFALSRWKLRKWLIGTDEAPPSNLPEKKQRLLIFYGFATWIYRFFLFLGIALLVYHLFFKLLGIILFLVEIYYFILAPIISELLTYIKTIREKPITPNAVKTGIAILGIAFILIIPWQSSITVPAELVFKQKKAIYTENTCYANFIIAKNQKTAQLNQILFQGISPELDMRKTMLLLQLKTTELKILQQQGLGKILGPEFTDKTQLDALKNNLNSLENEMTLLTLKAPFSGEIINRAPMITQDRWYSDDTYLMNIIVPNEWVVNAYISENEINRLAIIKNAYFISNNPSTPVLKLKLLARPVSSQKELQTPYQASIYGGLLSTNKDKKENNKLILKNSYFPFSFELSESTNITQEQRGIVVMDVQRQSIIKRLYLKIAGILIRESSF